MTKAEFDKHLANVGGGPKSDAEIAKAERLYQGRILQDRAEIAAAEFEARRPPGAAPLSRFAGLRASMPSFAQDIAALPEVEEVAETNGKNGKVEHVPLDTDMLKAIGKLWVEIKSRDGRAKAWDEIEVAIMSNLHRLVPGYGTLKDIIGMVRALDEYSNPVSSDKKGKADKTSLYRKALLMDEGEE